MTILVIQALKTLGRENVTFKTVRVLRSRLSEDDKATMLIEAAKSTDWVYDTIRQICGGLSGRNFLSFHQRRTVQGNRRETNIYMDGEEKQTVIFAYSKLFTNSATLQVIRLEIGALVAQTPVKDSVFARLDLLKKVIDFKMKFYPRAWAKYAEAVPGTLKLTPPRYRLNELAADYNAMKDMLYGGIPSFDSVMYGIKMLEQQINEL